MMLPASVCAKNRGLCGPSDSCNIPPLDMCKMIGGNNWTWEMTQEAKASCALYKSMCGSDSTYWMVEPIISGGNNPSEEVQEFKNAAESVLRGGPKECVNLSVSSYKKEGGYNSDPTWIFPPPPCLRPPCHTTV